MPELLASDRPVSLPSQLREILAQRIDQGRYQPGRKIDSIRKLSQEFGVSTLVVVKAISLLEQQGAVIRMPGKGVFLAEDYRRGLTTTRVAFAFPESALSLDLMPAENWAAVTEMHRGMLAGAVEHQARVRFEHFAEAQGELQINQQLRRFDEYDAAIFVGHQLKPLRQAVARQKPIIQLGEGGEGELDGFAGRIDYDRDDAMNQLVRHAAAREYRRCGLLIFKTRSAHQAASLNAKTAAYQDALLRQGVSVPEPFVCEVDTAKAAVPQMADWLKRSRLDFVFCAHADQLLVNLYRAAQGINRVIGQDLGVACIGSGFTLQGLSPTCTFIKPPLNEMGKKAIDLAILQLKSNPAGQPHPISLLKADLVQGQSTARCSSHLPFFALPRGVGA